MALANQTESLVKYETAILVSSSFISAKNKGKKAMSLPPLDKNGQARNEDYLNKILPP